MLLLGIQQSVCVFAKKRSMLRKPGSGRQWSDGLPLRIPQHQKATMTVTKHVNVSNKMQIVSHFEVSTSQIKVPHADVMSQLWFNHKFLYYKSLSNMIGEVMLLFKFNSYEFMIYSTIGAVIHVHCSRGSGSASFPSEIPLDKLGQIVQRLHEEI